jgi:hypothetical protein
MEKIDRRNKEGTYEAQVYQGLQKLIKLRKNYEVFSCGEMEVMDTGNDHILG